MKRIVISVSAILIACSPMDKVDKNAPAHHLADGTFVNTNGAAISISMGELIKWRRAAPNLEPLALSSAMVNTAALAYPESTQLTWIGHSTFLIQMDGLNILTDPVFSDHASPVSFAGPKRTTPPAISVEQLPVIDIVLISHNHYDHLDKRSIKALQAKQPDNAPRYYVPLRQKAWFDKYGVSNVTELDWWSSIKVQATTIHAVPVQHWSSRSLS